MTVTGDEGSGSSVSIVDSNSLPWVNGLEAIAGMTAEWRSNLGPADELEAAYRLFNLKVLRTDPATGARFEVLDAKPGYADLTDAFHDTVEESFCLTGSVILSGEGTMHPGSYFWRPPGFVHGAETPAGFSCLLMTEGVSPGDRSGPVTRRIRPRSEAGTNALEPDLERAVGPRGFVRHIPSDLLPWIPGPAFARSQDSLDGYDLDRCEFKVLSQNPISGAQTLLVRFAAGFSQAGRHRHGAAQQLFVLDGALGWEDRELATGTYVHRPAGTEEPPLRSDEGATVFMKAGAWLDFQPTSGAG